MLSSEEQQEEKKQIEAARVKFPETHTSYAAKDRTDFLLRLSQLVEGRVQFESGWISQRMTWLVISQSFLFTGFANASSDTPLHTLLRAIIVFIALTQAIFAYVAIRAAKAVNAELAPLRGTIDAAIKGIATSPTPNDAFPAFEEWTILGATRRGDIKNTFKRGGLASHVIPITLICAWLALAAALIYTRGSAHLPMPSTPETATPTHPDPHPTEPLPQRQPLPSVADQPRATPMPLPPSVQPATTPSVPATPPPQAIPPQKQPLATPNPNERNG